MRKIIRKAIAVVLCVACLVQFSGQAFAAGLFGKTYVKEMFLSYGYTPEEAKKYLKDNGYEIVDHNLNEGADSALSKKRAVYLGYKTTKDPEEAITDMKLMNMKGNYSVNDYQLLLEDQASQIRTFIDDFITAVTEYRNNYNKGQTRAVTAHDLLNLLYDDDTGIALGDLLLEKIREEYTSREFDALPAEEQAKHADMTTILMQSNATSVYAIELIIALATDSTDSVWLERYEGVESYDAMLDALIEQDMMTPNTAMARLRQYYDDDARTIASKLPEYLEFMKGYTESGITLASSETEIVEHFKDGDSSELLAWYSAGTQYEMLKSFADEDGLTLLDIITDENSDFEGEDRTLLYPLVSVLTEGQRACLGILPFNQLVSMGINDDAVMERAKDSLGFITDEIDAVSIYEGIDRAIFSEKVAMTKSATNLQNSSDKDVTSNWFDDGISGQTKVLYICIGMASFATIYFVVKNTQIINFLEGVDVESFRLLDARTQANLESGYANMQTMQEACYYIGITMACITAFLMVLAAWRTYSDLMEYYNVEFSPIPMYMVDQGVDEKDEKTYTYYKAVSCNRQEAKLVDDRTKVLESCGDINGDCGLQWVALYTTCDRAAGDPITADFIVQYANSNIPGERTALSLFGEKSAQNLTNEKNGFTYSDSKKGIYLFYATDPLAFTGSVITGGFYALIAGACIIVIAVAFYVVSRKRKGKSEQKAG